eukprot:gene14083-17215_t
MSLAVTLLPAGAAQGRRMGRKDAVARRGASFLPIIRTFAAPDGETFNQQIANQLSLQGNLLFLCGHYKGVDQRVRDLFITKEISIGDYVLSGGELAAAVCADAIIRLIPGVLNDETSALTDSFQDNLLAPPVYTRPAEFEGIGVPPVLLSGHEAKINEWRFEQSIERTKSGLLALVRKSDCSNGDSNNQSNALKREDQIYTKKVV